MAAARLPIFSPTGTVVRSDSSGAKRPFNSTSRTAPGTATRDTSGAWLVGTPSDSLNGVEAMAETFVKRHSS